MRNIKFLTPLVLVLFSFTKTAVAPPQDSFCGIKNVAFNVKEEIAYTVFYAVAGIYVNREIRSLVELYE